MSTMVRRVQERDATAWASLYGAYRAFYRFAEDSDAVAQAWRWITTGEHGLMGLVAVDDADEPIGLANLRWFARPSRATLGLYVDDLFTAPNARGTGAGTALLRRAAEIASAEGADVVRWITAADNETARRLYAEVAQETAWVTYDMPPAERPSGLADARR